MEANRVKLRPTARKFQFSVKRLWIPFFSSFQTFSRGLLGPSSAVHFHTVMLRTLGCKIVGLALKFTVFVVTQPLKTESRETEIAQKMRVRIAPLLECFWWPLTNGKTVCRYWTCVFELSARDLSVCVKDLWGQSGLSWFDYDYFDIFLFSIRLIWNVKYKLRFSFAPHCPEWKILEINVYWIHCIL